MLSCPLSGGGLRCEFCGIARKVVHDAFSAFCMMAGVILEIRNLRATDMSVILKTGVMIFLMLLGVQAQATPGGVDARGCHESKKIGYHCHPSRAGNAGASGESPRERDRRLKRECKGAVNAGVCQGYTR